MYLVALVAVAPRRQRLGVDLDSDERDVLELGHQHRARTQRVLQQGVLGGAYRRPLVLHLCACGQPTLGCEGDALMLLLDSAGVQVSVGSACAAGATETSHVMRAMGVDSSLARGSLRFSVGWSTSDEDIDFVLRVLPGIVSRARGAYTSIAGSSR